MQRQSADVDIVSGATQSTNAFYFAVMQVDQESEVSAVFVHTFAPMGTVVTIQVVGHGDDEQQRADRAEGVARAAGWFESIEKSCSRFDPASELRRLTDRVGGAGRVSALLFAAIRFAPGGAAARDGAFDPTVGARMEARGFDRHHQTGDLASSNIAANARASHGATSCSIPTRPR